MYRSKRDFASDPLLLFSTLKGLHEAPVSGAHFRFRGSSELKVELRAACDLIERLSIYLMVCGFLFLPV